jgi:hypothetical protein
MTPQHAKIPSRYAVVANGKARGATYTPKSLSDFVAAEMVNAARIAWGKGPVRVLDPAVGEGELLASLLEHLPRAAKVEVYGFDTDARALEHAKARLRAAFPKAVIDLRVGDFLSFVMEMHGDGMQEELFAPERPDGYDLIIANPPYVRTQIMGAKQAQMLALQFGLAGRVDLYYAFVLGMAKVLRAHGVAGIIVSNRFMTTKAGAGVRKAIRDGFNLRHVWDLGDTKLFDAAVLPAVLLAEGKSGRRSKQVGFSSIYETQDAPEHEAQTAIGALGSSGVVAIEDGRRFRVTDGTLDESEGLGGIWRIATAESDAWLATVNANTWRTFRDVGKIRVGVKTCADRVFIRQDWDRLPDGERPELLRPLMTHHCARRYRADRSNDRRQILYPHECVDGARRAIDLEKYPRSKTYLERHKAVLENRKYVLEAGRQWHELWVPQDPAAWDRAKLVFRDISERPCFWIDEAGSVVNGDCYWMVSDRGEDDLLWLALAIGNSRFIEAFYDHRFNNKLYAGRRRFMTQYVEKFPLPNPTTKKGKAIVAQAKRIYDAVDSLAAEKMADELDRQVWEAFGLAAEEIAG